MIGIAPGAPATKSFIVGSSGGALQEIVDARPLTAMRVNASGRVTGFLTSGQSQAFLTGPNGAGVETLSLPAGGGYIGSSGSALNAAAMVTGAAIRTGNTREAMVTGPNGVGMQTLGFGGPTFDQPCWDALGGYNSQGSRHQRRR